MTVRKAVVAIAATLGLLGAGAATTAATTNHIVAVAPQVHYFG